MRASSVFIMLLVMDAFLFFGAGAFTELTPTPGDGMEEIGTRPFGYFIEGNISEGTLGTSANTTIVDAFMSLDIGGTGLAILDATGLYNIAAPMLAFLQLLVGFITSPFTFAQMSGLNELTVGGASIGMLFCSIYVLAIFFGIYQIWTGRQV